ncbi:MAG TPA: glycosyltransferase family 2 protein, partial [Candidatus Nitrosocosmicus sp.]|nr:glycosyltransferase family 2 protein [Candidatus Nitrosocosmicus sp.]
KNIERCINSLLWCDKIIVMWMGKDKTGEIAIKLGAEVIEMNKNPPAGGDFVGVQKNINWAIDNCKTDWILRVDADEVVSKELQNEIEVILNKSEGSLANARNANKLRDSSALPQNDNIVAYGIPRKHYIWGGFLKGGDWSYDRLIRLFRPQFARYDPIVHVHEQFRVTGKIGYLKHHLLHYSHPTIGIALKKFDTYTDVEVNDMKQSLPKAIFNFFIQPPYVFLRWMIWHHGYRDGLRGIIAASLRAWYEYLLYSKYLVKKLSKK